MNLRWVAAVPLPAAYACVVLLRETFIQILASGFIRMCIDAARYQRVGVIKHSCSLDGTGWGFVEDPDATVVNCCPAHLGARIRAARGER